MTGKHIQQRQVNRLRVSSGHDGIWRVRTIDLPHRILFSDSDHDVAYRWAHRCREYARKEPIWTAEDLEYLEENYGRISADTIARRLNRTCNALKIITFRKLGINQRSNIYTARAVAGELGIF